MYTGIETSRTRGMHAGHGSCELWRVHTCHHTGSERSLRVGRGRCAGRCGSGREVRIAFSLDLERDTAVVPAPVERKGGMVVVHAPLLWVMISRGRLSIGSRLEGGLMDPREVGGRLEVGRPKFFLCFREVILSNECWTFAFTLILLAVRCGAVQFNSRSGDWLSLGLLE